MALQASTEYRYQRLHARANKPSWQQQQHLFSLTMQNLSTCKQPGPPGTAISRAGSDLEQIIISDHFSGVSEANILYDIIMLGDFLIAFNPSLTRTCAKPQIQVLRTSHLHKTTSFWSRRQVLHRKFAEGNSFRKLSSKKILLSLFLKGKKPHTSSQYNHHLQIPSMPSSLRCRCKTHVKRFLTLKPMRPYCDAPILWSKYHLPLAGWQGASTSSSRTTIIGAGSEAGRVGAMCFHFSL